MRPKYDCSPVDIQRTIHVSEKSIYGAVDAWMTAAEAERLKELLGLCRVMHLRYKIEPCGELLGKYAVGVSYTDWPSDFFHPHNQDGSFVVVGSKDILHHLCVAINGVVAELRRNTREFRHWFLEYWREKHGKDFITGLPANPQAEPAPPG